MKKIFIFTSFILGVLLYENALGQATVPTAFDLSVSNFSLTSHSSTSFPANMAIGQRKNSTDGSFNADITTDATNGSSAGNWQGEGSNGISYMGSGSFENACFLLRLNGTGRNTIQVSWVVRDITAQANTNYIELQWSVGGSGTWNDVSGDLYQQGTTSNGTAFSVTLPSGAEDQSDLRLRWIYYEVGTGNRDRLAIDQLSVTSTGASSCSTPTTQASAFTTSNVQETSMTVGFTRGNGNKVLVLARQGSAVNQDPANDVAYTANATFGSGDAVGTGNYVVYSGTSNSFTLSGLAAGTTYHFAVYEFNTIGATICYNTTELTGNQTTPTCPTAQSSFVSAGNATETTLDVTWTRGDGDYVLVVARAGSAVNSDPVNGNLSLYNDNAIFGSGDQIGAGNYVVYDGTGTNVTVTGLSASTTYHFAIYEYKIDGSDNVCYKTPAATGSGTTSFPPSTVVIYEMYGGGGNSGAPYCNDFVVLKNCSASGIDIGGYSIQYAGATNSFSTGNTVFYEIPSNTIINPGDLLGIKFAAGTGTGCSTTYPSYFTLDGSIAIGANNAKVALANNTTLVSGPTSSNVVDFVGCGTANQYEGSNKAPAMSNTASIYRSTNGGCNDTNDNSADFQSRSPLPIELISFHAVISEKSTLLSFSTASERNNSHFDIERSTDGRTFEKIGEVKGAGDSQVAVYYTFSDRQPARGMNYYRLRQVDFDGTERLSKVVSLQFGQAGGVVLFPTPVAETMNVRFDEAFATDANWQVVDVNGRVVSEGVFAAEQKDFSIPVATLTQGAYILRVTSGQQTITQQFRKL